MQARIRILEAKIAVLLHPGTYPQQLSATQLCTSEQVAAAINQSHPISRFPTQALPTLHNMPASLVGLTAPANPDDGQAGSLPQRHAVLRLPTQMPACARAILHTARTLLKPGHEEPGAVLQIQACKKTIFNSGTCNSGSSNFCNNIVRQQLRRR